MKRAFNILILAFYTYGTLCLPMGDFAMLKDLPEMYRHCKATEDRDLNIFEFLTEHVSSIGQFIESVEHEPEEDGDKPHEPKQTEHKGQLTIFLVTHFTFAIKQIIPIQVNPSIHTDNFITSDYISKIFRPPIA